MKIRTLVISTFLASFSFAPLHAMIRRHHSDNGPGKSVTVGAVEPTMALRLAVRGFREQCNVFGTPLDPIFHLILNPQHQLKAIDLLRAGAALAKVVGNNVALSGEGIKVGHALVRVLARYAEKDPSLHKPIADLGDLLAVI